MPKGKPLDEETKKKISEALKKNSTKDEPSAGQRSTVRDVEKALGKEGVELYKTYQDSAATILSKTNTVKDLQAKNKSLTLKGKKGKAREAIKAQKEQIKAEIAKQREQIKAERERIKEIKKEATALKKLKKAEASLKKLEERKAKAKKKTAELYDKFDKLLKKTKDPDKIAEINAKYGELEERVVDMFSRMDESEKKLKDVISKKGHVDSTTNDLFGKLSECNHHPIKLASGEFWREKTEYEANTNFVYLQDQFDAKQQEISDQLVDLTAAEIDRIIAQADSAQQQLNWAWLLGVAFLLRGKVKTVVKDWIKATFEAGKMSGAQDVKTEIPANSKQTTQLINYDANEITEIYAGELEATTRSFTRDIIAVGGVSSVAFRSELKNRLAKKASTMAANISDGKTSEYLNKGREAVFKLFSQNIIGYQRSEILDGRTCNFCLSIDGRVLKASDPLAQLGGVHYHCRGVNIPIFAGSQLPASVGYPKTITDNLDLVDGKPLINNFKQLKKPINKSNAAVQEEIQRRIESNNG